MYRVDRNNFHKKVKNSMVYTPDFVSYFLFRLLEKQNFTGLLLDPCVGAGSLLKPWQRAGYSVVGIDIVNQGFVPTIKRNFLDVEVGEVATPDIVLMNPPFNIDSTTKEYIQNKYGGRPLLPELWLQKTIELFGKDIPIALFTPYGFRLNQTISSSRWKKFMDDTYPPISSIVSLPKNIFEGILFHSEILLFNMPGMRGHYFYGEKL